MAGAILPFIAGEPWIIKGNEYYDGGLHYIDPSQAAAEIHATHTFVLNTRPIGTKLKPWSGLVERKFKSLDENYPGAGTHYLECLKNYCEVYNDLPYGATELNGMQMYRHATEHSTGVNRLTMDQEKLTEGVKAGYKSILDIFYQQGRVGMLPSLM
jgi:predicted patatin/cPLA2 family phospholipase